MEQRGSEAGSSLGSGVHDELVEPGEAFVCPPVADLVPLVRIAKGRTATVQLCRHPASGRVFALKAMPREAAKSRAQAIFRERDITKSLQHRSIMRLLGTDKDDAHLYFVLEAVLGGPLYKHIRAAPGGRLETGRALTYFGELVVALDYLRSRRVIHRDIKGSNVVLDHRGRVKLVDFGAAKRLPDGEERTFTHCGTLHCMAPEMLRGDGHSFPVDWWALGVLLYEMLTGAPPFTYGSDAMSREVFLENIRQAMEDGQLFCSRPAFDRDPDTVPLIRGLLQQDESSRFDASQAKAAACLPSYMDWTALEQGSYSPPDFDRALGEIDEAFEPEPVDCNIDW